MPRAELRQVYKRFGPTEALCGASLVLGAGEVHALLGENGAGKTTLVRTLYGSLVPDRGEVRIEDRPVVLRGPAHALSLGIGMVHQHSMLIPALSVAENLALGSAGAPFVSRATLRDRARVLLARHGLKLDPDERAERLGVAQQQRLEIVRALSHGAQTLILDEPTAVLAPSEVRELLELMARLRAEGRTIVFISHKLEEVTQICDHVTVLRAGRTVATRDASDLDVRELGRIMVGQDPPPPGRPLGGKPGPVALRLAALRAEGIGDLELELRRGQILAIAGIDGNGQTPLEEAFAGVRPLQAGSLDVLAPPLSLISGDRQRTGLVLDLTLAENLVLEDAGRGGGSVFLRGFLRRPELLAQTHAAVERFDILGQAEARVRTLSGGNQQKLCVARALRRAPGVLVAVNPTRGLDLGAIAAVRDELRAQARAGTAVLVISTDLDEVLELGDSIAVLFRGSLQPVPSHAGGTNAAVLREEIGALMLGMTADPSTDVEGV